MKPIICLFIRLFLFKSYISGCEHLFDEEVCLQLALQTRVMIGGLTLVKTFGAETGIIRDSHVESMPFDALVPCLHDISSHDIDYEG